MKAQDGLNKIMKRISVILCVLLASCSPEATQSIKTEPDSSRVKIERIGVFYDDIAYRGTRGIYVITDSTTGKEFIGISGVGITETGSHSSGKTRIQDER